MDFLELDEMHFQMIRQNIMGIIIRDMIRVPVSHRPFLPGHREKNVSHQSAAERFLCQRISLFGA